MSIIKKIETLNLILDACPNEEEIVQIRISKGFIHFLWIRAQKYLLEHRHPVRTEYVLKNSSSGVYTIYFNKKVFKCTKESGQFFFLLGKNSNYKKHAYMMFKERYVFSEPLLKHKIYYSICDHRMVETGDIFNLQYKFEEKGYYHNKVYCFSSTKENDFTSIVNLEQSEIHGDELALHQNMISHLKNRVSLCYNYVRKTDYKQLAVHTISTKGRVQESIWLEIYGEYALVLAYKRYPGDVENRELLYTGWLEEVDILNNIKYIITSDITVIPMGVYVKMEKPKNMDSLAKLFPSHLDGKSFFKILKR